MSLSPMASAAASAQTPPPPAQPAQAAETGKQVVSMADGYVLGVGDVVEVSVLGREEFNPRVQIQNDGTLQLPFLGTVKASDLTILQFRENVRQALIRGGYYASPVVNVAVASYASRYVTVLGEVATPGIVPIDRSYHLSEILARVGGPRGTASDQVKVTRENGEELELSIRESATSGGDKDPEISPGDKIYVPAAKTFYIYGQVNAPGTYQIDRDMTLRKALARGGGLTPMGSEKRVKVFRNGEEIKKFDPSEPIIDGDVVVVGERFF
ncbi:MAG: capsular biosynthesis protein [Sphingomonadales bacterium]|nr:MAG: capsular biosynthesis protein [Sphingomonadales bacterium]TNF05326.1 MAG: capsular biosynthesis protein [Sphingomonadales bacterium]